MESGPAYLTLRVLLMVMSLHFPSEQGRNTDDSAEYPHHRDHHHSPPWCPLLQVVDGLGDTPVSIQTDQAQVNYTSCTQEDVHGTMDVAPETTKYPIPH